MSNVSPGWSGATMRRLALILAAATVAAVFAMTYSPPAQAAPGDPDSCLSPVSDEFNGNSLDPKWEIVRDVPSLRSVGGGTLNMMWNGNVDMNGSTATATNILLQNMPTSAFTLTTKIDTSEAKQQSNQVGVIFWQSEGSGNNNFAKITYNARTNSGDYHWAERYQTVNSSSSNLGNNNLGLTAGQPDEVYIRVISDGHPQTPSFQPAYSTDGGQTWINILEPFFIDRSLGTIKAGLLLARGENNPDGTARFDWFRVCVPSLDTVAPAVSHTINPTEPDGPTGEYYLGPVGISLGASDGVEGSGVDKIEWRNGSEGTWNTYTNALSFTELGDYEIQYRATDLAGNVSPVAVASFRIDTPPLDPAAFTLSLKAKPKKVKPGAQTKIGLTLGNSGEATGTNVKVCAAGQKKKSKIVGKKCITVGDLEANGTYQNNTAFWALIPKSNKKKKAKVTVTVTADDAPTVKKTLTLTVKQKKKKKKKK